MRGTGFPVLAAVLLLAGCEAPVPEGRPIPGPGTAPAAASPQEGAPTPATAEKPPYDPTLATATLRFRTRLLGTPPKMRPIKFDADPECGKQHSTAVPEETIVSRDGLLANAVVFVSRGAERWAYPVPTEPVVLDQRGCMFVPHVFTVMAGQPVHIRNSDPVCHQVHGIPKENREFDECLMKGARPFETRFEKAELGILIKCDIHGWMRSFAGVFGHPFHAVTDGNGSAVLRLPPGEYEVAVWHEYGKFEKPSPRAVEVADGGTAELEFVFRVP